MSRVLYKKDPKLLDFYALVSESKLVLSDTVGGLLQEYPPETTRLERSGDVTKLYRLAVNHANGKTSGFKSESIPQTDLEVALEAIENALTLIDEDLSHIQQDTTSSIYFTRKYFPELWDLAMLWRYQLHDI